MKSTKYFCVELTIESTLRMLNNDRPVEQIEKRLKEELD
jgi:hypothetical protein